MVTMKEFKFDLAQFQIKVENINFVVDNSTKVCFKIICGFREKKIIY
jgi:hypothetical protein